MDSIPRNENLCSSLAGLQLDHRLFLTLPFFVTLPFNEGDVTNKEFENYLALVTRLLRLNNKHADELGSEMRDHLETRVMELIESGACQEDATRRALEEFGDAASLAQRFHLVTQNSQKRWMMRFATFSVAAMFLLVVFVFSMWPENARFGSPSQSFAQESEAGAKRATTKSIQKSDATRQNQFVVETLQQIIELHYEEIPFVEIMENLADDLQINIVLDQSATDDSLTEDQPITFKARELPLSSALGLMLEAHNATYVVDRGVLKIISRDIADDPTYFRRTLIDCRRLIAKLEKFESLETEELPGMGRGGGAGGLGGPGGVGGGDDEEEGVRGPVGQLVNQRGGGGGGGLGGGGISGDGIGGGGFTGHWNPSDVVAQNIIDVIQTSISPDGWDVTNGDATVTDLYGILVVVAPERTIKEIKDFLQDFEHNLDQVE